MSWQDSPIGAGQPGVQRPYPATETSVGAFNDYVASLRQDLAGHYAYRDQQERDEAARRQRLAEIEASLGALHSQDKYRPISPRVTVPLVDSLGHYYDLLAQPADNLSRLGSQDIYKPEMAVAYLAAASMLNRMPLEFTGLLGAVSRHLGFGRQALYDNVERAREYLVSNLLLLKYPNGAQDLPDLELRRFGLKRDELRRLDMGGTGLGAEPATFAVVIADIIHSKKNPILPEERPISERKLRAARTTLAEPQRLANFAGHGQIDRLNLQPRKRKGVQHAQELINDDYDRRVTLKQRRDIERTVLEAGGQWGFRPDDTRSLHVMAELLVMKAHGFPHYMDHLSDGIVDTLVARFMEAVQKSRVRGIKDLPAGRGGEARQIYLACVEYQKHKEQQAQAQRQAAAQGNLERLDSLGHSLRIDPSAIGETATNFMLRLFGESPRQR